MCARPMPTCALRVCGPWALGMLCHADVRLQPCQLIQGPGAARSRVGVRPCPPHGPACIAPQHLGVLPASGSRALAAVQLVAAEIQARGSDRQRCRASYLDLLGPLAQVQVAAPSLQSFQMARREGSRRASPSSCLQPAEACAPQGRALRGGASPWAASWILWWSALSPSHCLFTKNHSLNASLHLSILGQGPQMSCPGPPELPSMLCFPHCSVSDLLRQ